jgi:hypothetical protein
MANRAASDLLSNKNALSNLSFAPKGLAMGDTVEKAGVAGPFMEGTVLKCVPISKSPLQFWFEGESYLEVHVLRKAFAQTK